MKSNHAKSEGTFFAAFLDIIFCLIQFFGWHWQNLVLDHGYNDFIDTHTNLYRFDNTKINLNQM